MKTREEVCTLRYWMRNPELAISMLILLVFLLLASLQVFSRFVLNLPFTWTEELTSNLVIWMTFLGAAAVQKEDSHIRVELLENILPKKAVKIIYSLFDLCILIFLLALVYGGWVTLGELAHERTPALQIPFRYIFLVIPISSVLMSVYVVKNIIKRFR